MNIYNISIFKAFRQSTQESAPYPKDTKTAVITSVESFNLANHPLFIFSCLFWVCPFIEMPFIEMPFIEMPFIEMPFIEMNEF